MSDNDKPLSPRHERFVHEYLKDGNATQAYIRAGYAARCAQFSSSKLLRHPRVEAAVAAGRHRIAQALEITVERMAAEYAKIAFASVDDYVEVRPDGHLRIDLAKAGRAQRDGLLDLTVTDLAPGRDGAERPQRVRIRLGKLQALAALTKQLAVYVAMPAPAVTAEQLAERDERIAGLWRVIEGQREEKARLYRQLTEALAARGGAGDGYETAADEPAPYPEATQPDPYPDATQPDPYPEATQPQPEPPSVLLPQIQVHGAPHRPPVRHVQGTKLTAEIRWPGQNTHRLPNSAEALEIFARRGARPCESWW